LADTNKGDYYYYGMGRRKTAVARVRLFASSGDGSITVNGKNAQNYFGQSDTHLATIASPLRVLELGDYTMTIRVAGGGTSGQAGAIRHALARALVRMNPEFKHALRKAGFLTRDPRMKERKKYGLKRARKAPQYTKR
jgi:small subunit ribosomal protein S9